MKYKINNQWVDVNCVSALYSSGSSGGITPTGSLSIDSNGTYNVTNYASAVVNVVDDGSIKQNIYDTQVIPDKYNSGCSDESLLVLSTTFGLNEGMIYSENFINKVTPDSDGVYRNILFKNSGIYISSKEINKTELVFENCKFICEVTGSLNNAIQKLALSPELDVIFRRCTFIGYGSAVNSSIGQGTYQFYNCYVDEMSADGFKGAPDSIYDGCYVRTCGLAEGSHADGIQVTGDRNNNQTNYNVTVNNCRFENPAIKDVNLSNAAIFHCIEFNESNGSKLTNIYAIGGGHTIGIGTKNAGTVTNMVASNIQVGCSYRYSTNYDVPESVSYVASAITESSNLYVSSVRKVGSVIKLNVTNYTNQERTLKVITSNGTTEFTVPACPKYSEYYDTYTSIDQFPFNLNYEVADADYVVCYDGTKQIRFVNYTDEPVYIENASEGITPTGEISITANGTYNVTNYASAVVNIASSGSGISLPSNMKMIEFEVDNDTNTEQVIPHECQTTPKCVSILYEDAEKLIGVTSYSFIGITTGNIYTTLTDYAKNITNKKDIFTLTIDETNVTLTNNNTTYYLREGKYMVLLWI